MTREEAIKILQNIYFEAPEVTEALQLAIGALSQSYLPSNLDEAAEEYFLKTYGIDNKAISEDIKRAVKFGAEWIVRQGITVEGDVEGNWRNQEDAPYEIYVTSDCLPKDTEFKIGDKVIMQIQKK